MTYRRVLNFILFGLGAFLIYQSYSLLVGSEYLPEPGISCRAICGLALLSSEVFGATVTHYISSFLFLIAGIFLAYIPFSESKHARDQREIT